MEPHPAQGLDGQDNLRPRRDRASAAGMVGYVPAVRQPGVEGEREPARGLDLQGGGEERSQPAQGMEAETGARRKVPNGSYHCTYFTKSGKCDVCKHMLERTQVKSSHFGVKHAIAGHNIHPPATQPDKLRWFVYMEECVHPEGVFQYIGSTTSMTERWANTKSRINGNKKPGTGLETHYKEGCSQNLGPDLASVRVTLLEHMDTNHGRLASAEHQAGPGCRCTECGKLKSLEDKWICRMGTYHGVFGLNERNEITSKARSGF